jgi:2-oxoglutarate ferredoxin oxidoreductase subunit beta
VAEVGESALLVHDPGRGDPGLAFSLAKLAEVPTAPTPIGIFRDVDRPVYHQRASDEPASEQQLSDLLEAGETWTVA